MNITKASYLISSPSEDKCPPADRPEYAFIGRSNVGKSSLINMLCNQQHLAKTSANPGKTQHINHFEIESKDGKSKSVSRWYLVDLPGYGFAITAQSVRRRWEQMIEQYLRKRSSLLTVFVLIDARLLPQKIDLEFINQLGKWGVPFTLVFTKTDKVKPGLLETHTKAFLNAMRETWQFLPQSFITSALTKQGREDILALISASNRDFFSRA